MDKEEILQKVDSLVKDLQKIEKNLTNKTKKQTKKEIHEVIFQLRLLSAVAKLKVTPLEFNEEDFRACLKEKYGDYNLS
jgi:hypothetical protein